MGYQTIAPEQLVNRLGAAPLQRITWVIGAGFSAASGIPLAEGIADRLLSYEFLRATGRPAPWASGPPSLRRWEREPIRAFLEWYEADSAAQERATLLGEAKA